MDVLVLRVLRIIYLGIGRESLRLFPIPISKPVVRPWQKRLGNRTHPNEATLPNEELTTVTLISWALGGSRE